MIPKLSHHNLIARCPNCLGAVTNFDYRHSQGEYGYVLINKDGILNGVAYNKEIYRLVRCSGCGRGGAYQAIHSKAMNSDVLVDYWPRSAEFAKIPEGTPKGISSEVREAEMCASVGAWRAGSALLRSALDKILRSNGYSKGNLFANIDEAFKDGILTESRRRRAHEEIRVLGNDILHDAWKEVSPEDFEAAHHYCQRIIEDFYDDRPSVEKTLQDKGRLPN